jgi:hypothetical protein
VAFYAKHIWEARMAELTVIERKHKFRDGSIMVTGIGKMAPQAGNHTRGISFFTEPFAGHDGVPNDRPIINVTIYSPGEVPNVGTVFGVYKINVNLIGDLTQIAVWAQNVETGVPSDLDFYCSFTAIGQPKPPKANDG